MTTVLSPGARSGAIRIPASKSQAHRMLICAALSETPSQLIFSGFSDDIRATIQCLTALGAQFTPNDAGLYVSPLCHPISGAVTLDVGESGSTLRFLLPILGALGIEAEVILHGRLPQRPLGALAQQLMLHGMTLRQDGDRLYVGGKLCAGTFTLPGDVSSQFISGLLFALPLLSKTSTLCVSGTLQSASYVRMTEQALHEANIHVIRNETSWTIPGAQHYSAPTAQVVEGDWSNAAFYFCIGALSKNGVGVYGLRRDSLQPDRAITEILRRFGVDVQETDEAIWARRKVLRGITVDAGPIPDLIPVVSVLAAFAEGQTHIINAARLRLKESDRLQSTAAMLRALGAAVTEQPDGLVITGSDKLGGGSVDTCGDHRIAMSAAVAACGCYRPVEVCGNECVAKSYPAFWQDFSSLQEEGL